MEARLASANLPFHVDVNVGDPIWPFLPEDDDLGNAGFSPIWNPEFFGNTMMVNGNTWPFQVVERRRYRFRFLNGCQSRFLILDFANIPGVEVWQIGNEGGFLSEPVNLTALENQLPMGLAERADVIVDFTNVRWAITCSAISVRTNPSAAESQVSTSTPRTLTPPGRSCSSESLPPKTPTTPHLRSSSPFPP